NLGGKLDLQKDKNSFILGLSLEIHSNSPSSPLLHLIPTILPSMQYPVFHNVVFPMPSCSVSTKSTSSAPLIIKNISATSSPLTHSPLLLNTAAETYMNCSIRLSTCPEHELCQQIDKSKPAGTCVCMPDYVRDKSGKCIYSPSVSTTTEFLNSLELSGVPSDKLRLNVGVPQLLIRNLDVPRLRNGARLQITYLGENVVPATVMTGIARGESFLIPRILIIPKNLPSQFKR
ncbi:hypothetical protein AVEN_212904-1, partial [Araneus ventricosus]